MQATDGFSRLHMKSKSSIPCSKHQTKMPEKISCQRPCKSQLNTKLDLVGVPSVRPDVDRFYTQPIGVLWLWNIPTATPATRVATGNMNKQDTAGRTRSLPCQPAQTKTASKVYSSGFQDNHFHHHKPAQPGFAGRTQ